MPQCGINFLLDSVQSGMVRQQIGLNILAVVEGGLAMASELKKIVKTAFSLFIVLFLMIDPAMSAEEVFYSIHFATLKSIKDVDKQVNALKEKAPKIVCILKICILRD